MTATAKCFALIIGNGYQARRNGHLPNAPSDAQGLSRRLVDQGYTLIGQSAHRNVSSDQIRYLLSEVKSHSNDENSASLLFYFAGHGRETKGGANLELLGNETEVSTLGALTLVEVLSAVSVWNGLKLVIIDACREAHEESPLGNSHYSTTPTAIFDELKSASDFLVLQSTRSGMLAADNDGTGRSPFLAALDGYVGNLTADVPVLEFFSNITDTPIEHRSGWQKPELIAAKKWTKAWKMGDLMARTSQTALPPSRLLRLLREDPVTVSNVLARYGSLRRGDSGFGSFIVINERKLHTADLGALLDDTRLKPGYDFVQTPALLDLYEAAYEYRASVQTFIGHLRSVILSFEKAVVSAYPIVGSKGTVVGVTYPKDHYDYRDARATRDALGERMDDGKSLEGELLTREQRDVCAKYDYFSVHVDDDNIDFAPLLNTPGGDDKRRERLNRLFSLPQYGAGADTGAGLFAMFSVAKSGGTHKLELFAANPSFLGDKSTLKDELKYLVAPEMTKLIAAVAAAKLRLLLRGVPTKEDSHIFFGDLRSAAFSFDGGVVWVSPIRIDFSDTPKEYALVSVSTLEGFNYKKGRETVRNLLRDY